MRYIKTFESFDFEGTFINIGNSYNNQKNKDVHKTFRLARIEGKLKKVPVSNLEVKYLKRIHEKLGIFFKHSLDKWFCCCYYYNNPENTKESPYATINIEKYENNWYFVTVVNATLFLEEKYICNEIEGLMDLYKYLISNNYLKYTIQEFA